MAGAPGTGARFSASTPGATTFGTQLGGGTANPVAILPLSGVQAVGNVSPGGSTIDTTTLAVSGQPLSTAGTITSVSAFGSLTAAQTFIGSTVTVTAQLWSSPTPDNTFTPIPGAQIALAPSFTGIVGVGTTFSGLVTGLSIPVTAQTNLIWVIRADVVAGLDTTTTIQAKVSTGVQLQ